MGMDRLPRRDSVRALWLMRVLSVTQALFQKTVFDGLWGGFR